MTGRQREYEETEKSFCEQLVEMGWAWIEGDRSDPAVTERESFGQVLLEGRLRAAIRRINTDVNGEPWLDDDRVGQAVSTIRRLHAHKVMEANQEVYRLLHEGTQVAASVEHTGHSGEATVRYVDFAEPQNNDFLVVNQFRVDRPGSGKELYPDIVLFVNGLPMVVVECKASNATADPVEKALEQLFRYEGRHPDKPSIPRLFHYNQLMVATSFEDAVAGAIGAPHRFFLQWKDVWPADEEQIRDETGTQYLTPQHKLVAGMLRPSNLVELVRNFVLFDDTGSETTKIVARYQQFRAVQNTIRRLQNGEYGDADDPIDRRGGIIWHTQGSGKSLTMVFLVRAMRRVPILQRFKVVVVTDRKSLQRQLAQTARLTHQPVEVADDTAELKRLLEKRGEGLVFAMIQKYQERSELPESDDVFPELNDSEEILVMIDEAHRSQTQKLHANLLRALPNCARLGFTGTPILMGDKKRTHEIFGPYIDKYTIEQSVADGMTEQIYYEGRFANWGTRSDETLDMHFDAAFGHLSQDDQDEIRKRYVTKKAVGGSEDLIRAKARDMLWHYIDTVLPNGFKAQVVADSRESAVRYQHYLEQAKQEVLDEIDRADPAVADLDAEEIDQLPFETRRLVRAFHHADVVERLEFAAVISGDQEDPEDWSRWSSNGRVNAHIGRFKKPLVHEKASKRDGLAFLCVNSMLLTGFDAPIEQVMYIDRSLRQHNLLQAIARTNRTYEGKTHGLIVDYWGLAEELNEALNVYSQTDIEGAWREVGDELPRLDDRHHRVVSLFTTRGVDIADTEDCVMLLEDVALRAEFLMRYEDFLESLDIVMPRPEALDYERDAELLGLINQKAAKRFRDDEQRDLRGASEKVRTLLDEYVRSQGVEPRIEPVSIMDADFEEHLDKERSPRAKASEMEHAARHHIDVHYDEDPVRYEALSQRLEEIRAQAEGDWERMLEMLKELKERMERPPEDPDDTGLDGRRELPFYRVLKQELPGEPDESVRAYIDALAEETQQLVEMISYEVARVDFWKNPHYQEQLHKEIATRIFNDYDTDPARAQAIATRLVNVARENRHRFSN
ncbi:MAG: type I restriction endonuclease subunit R [Myxococcota bacterium]